MGVLQIGGELDFLQKALRSEQRGELRMEHLDGDRTVVPMILCQVDRGHVPSPELTLDAVALG
jgi:hypothetical protein